MPRQRSGPKPRTNKDGTQTVWTDLIDVGADPETGRRRVRRVSAATREECEVLSAQLRLIVAQERERGGSVRSRSDVTFGQAIERTLSRLDRTAGRPGHVKQSTAAQYRQRIRTLVNPTVQHLLGRAVDAITTRQIQALYDDLSAVVGPSTLRVLHVVLRHVFTDAVAAGDVSVSPVVGLRLPRVTREAHDIWTIDEARRIRALLIQLLRDPADPVGKDLTPRVHRHVLVYLVLLATGMRIGEACALHWDDLTLSGTMTIRIRRTTSRDLADGRIETAPKTRAGSRTIAISSELAGLLRDRHRAQIDRRTRYGRLWCGGDAETGHVFDQEDGQPLDPGSASVPLARLCGLANVRVIGPHGIRHTCGTHLAAAGVNPKALSVLLGHADVAITMRLYVHPDAAELRSLTAILDALSDPTKLAS